MQNKFLIEFCYNNKKTTSNNKLLHLLFKECSLVSKLHNTNSIDIINEQNFFSNKLSHGKWFYIDDTNYSNKYTPFFDDESMKLEIFFWKCKLSADLHIKTITVYKNNGELFNVSMTARLDGTETYIYLNTPGIVRMETHKQPSDTKLLFFARLRHINNIKNNKKINMDNNIIKLDMLNDKKKFILQNEKILYMYPIKIDDYLY